MLQLFSLKLHYHLLHHQHLFSPFSLLSRLNLVGHSGFTTVAVPLVVETASLFALWRKLKFFNFEWNRLKLKKKLHKIRFVAADDDRCLFPCVVRIKLIPSRRVGWEKSLTHIHHAENKVAATKSAQLVLLQQGCDHDLIWVVVLRWRNTMRSLRSR